MARFDWDAGNMAKCQKHGVSLDEIEALFIAGGQVLPDVAHASAEVRFIATGRNHAGRPLFVAFTLRGTGGDELIRPVSARYMHAREVKRYEEAAKGTDAGSTDDDR